MHPSESFDRPSKPVPANGAPLSNPLPPGSEHYFFDHVRSDLEISENVFSVGGSSYTRLDDLITRDELRDLLKRSGNGLGFLQQHNPVVRHVILRRRKALEEAGLMKPVAVEIHPRTDEADRKSRAFFEANGRAVETSESLREAFTEAETFTKALMTRNKGAGFMRSLLLQRICSLYAGRVGDRSRP
jgi:hypothetical protein